MWCVICYGLYSYRASIIRWTDLSTYWSVWFNIIEALKSLTSNIINLYRVSAHHCPTAPASNVHYPSHYSSASIPLMDFDIKWINSAITQKAHSSPHSPRKSFRTANFKKQKALSLPWKCPYLSKHTGFSWPVSSIWLCLLFNSLMHWNEMQAETQRGMNGSDGRRLKKRKNR